MYGLIQDNSLNKKTQKGRLKQQKVFKQVSIAAFQNSFSLESRQILLGLFPLDIYL